MPGRKTAQKVGKALEERVEEIARDLGLEVVRQVKVGRRVWGPVRKIDLVVWKDPDRRLGIECKFQKEKGTAQAIVIPVVAEIITASHGPHVIDGILPSASVVRRPIVSNLKVIPVAAATRTGRL